MNIPNGTLVMNNKYLGMIVSQKYYESTAHTLYNVEWYYKGKAYSHKKQYDETDIKIFIYALEKYKESKMDGRTSDRRTVIADESIGDDSRDN